MDYVDEMLTLLYTPETLKWARQIAEGDLPSFRQQPSATAYFEPLWICINLPNAEMMLYSPYNQYESMKCDSEEEPADIEDDHQNFLILNAGKSKHL